MVLVQVVMPATAAQLAALKEFFEGTGGAAGVGAGVPFAVRDRVIGRVQVRFHAVLQEQAQVSSGHVVIVGAGLG